MKESIEILVETRNSAFLINQDIKALRSHVSDKSIAGDHLEKMNRHFLAFCIELGAVRCAILKEQC